MTRMSRRLNVLISAYACEPGKGSEPEVGWQWALQMARFHDVTVLTRRNNRDAIEAAVEALRGTRPLPRFVYHDRGSLLLQFKRRFKAVKLYYVLWQRSAREVIARLHELHRYDLLHHVTFAAFRYPVAIWGHGVPCIWGPIGGIESLPARLLPWRHPASLTTEVLRNSNNLLQATPFHILPQRARATTLILASTREMQASFKRLGAEARLMPTIGLSAQELPFNAHRPAVGPLKLLFVGNIITLKGVDLALEALKASGTEATFTLIGTGNYLEAAKRLAARLGLLDRVSFRGRLPRQEVLKAYADFDLFLFPSLHDTGGYAVLEAMFNELPVVCLDCGGPAVAVQEGCGVRVPLSSRGQIIEELGAAIRQYDGDRARLQAHGQAARQVVLQSYDWGKKAAEMDQCYRAAIDRADKENTSRGARNGYSGMGGMATFLHSLFSFEGLLLGVVVLCLVGALGFLSTRHLKKQASAIVNDTLPGLSYAGQANASLARAFERTLMLFLAENGDQRARLRREIDMSSKETADALAAYNAAIMTSEDRSLFEILLRRRKEYLEARNQMISLLDQDKQREALDFCQGTLLPTYNNYKDAGDKLLDYNMLQGKTRGESIMAVCTLTQFVVAAILIVIFSLGFLVGLFR